MESCLLLTVLCLMVSAMWKSAELNHPISLETGYFGYLSEGGRLGVGYLGMTSIGFGKVAEKA